MTLPEEMFNSIRSARMFMIDLLDPSITPKIPKQIRMRASARLKHFPNDFDINQLEKMHQTINKDKNIIINETNKELQSIAGEIVIANKRLSEVSQTLQEFINKP
jgi:hypothetical protein